MSFLLLPVFDDADKPGGPAVALRCSPRGNTEYQDHVAFISILTVPCQQQQQQQQDMDDDHGQFSVM